MANLHIIRSSGFTHGKLQQCLATVIDDDAILLIDDGVYNLNHPELLKVIGSRPLFALEEHVIARGLTPSRSEVKYCDYNKFVALTLDADKVITWQ
ncbi:sulfurtransferase complex subunit TusB [Thalassotalea sp. PS06]|uniref:sulfurtransferase complex subunit TusB n=1 Tax=Thalassotalea sp. PS06 TaxID=2594005 RepID=UPI0011622986|nr:sulfurtransferase complex subunit TusB [Thalassotalea sp. PS06]QDP01359.1 sulfurtransferase complex subunit TusB [Thalassotalea sp. PS06]